MLYKKQELQRLHETLVGFGARLTGSDPHKKYINFLEKELKEYGYKVKSDKHTFFRWEPGDYSLDFRFNNKNITVDSRDISYYPYSGCTDNDGITAPMKWCGKPVSAFLGSKGKIAVVSMPIFEAGCGLIFKKRAVYPENFLPPVKQGSPVVSTFAIAPFLSLAKKAGAKGVICVMTGCSDEMARYQYLPFIKKYAGIPALWVTETVGKKIIESARRGETATLKLKAKTVEDSPTRTIYAILEGKSKSESILINTHTDGSNAFEENGGIGLLSLAKHFAEKPIEQREKTLVFSFVTGHFQLKQFGNALNQATTKFLDAHKELWDGVDGHMRAVAGLTMEHLGCTEWRDNKEHTAMEKISDVDPELVYTSNKIMSNLYLDAVKGRKYAKVLLLRPKNLVHFGEGQPIYKKGIPSISLCPGPDYLCNVAPDGYIDKVNYEMMAEQIETFKKLIETIDTKKLEDMGKKQRFCFGLSF